MTTKRKRFKQSGGQFVEQCTHLVDLSRYLKGEITELPLPRMLSECRTKPSSMPWLSSMWLQNGQ